MTPISGLSSMTQPAYENTIVSAKTTYQKLSSTSENDPACIQLIKRLVDLAYKQAGYNQQISTTYQLVSVLELDTIRFSVPVEKILKRELMERLPHGRIMLSLLWNYGSKENDFLSGIEAVAKKASGKEIRCILEFLLEQATPQRSVLISREGKAARILLQHADAETLERAYQVASSKLYGRNPLRAGESPYVRGFLKDVLEAKGPVEHRLAAFYMNILGAAAAQINSESALQVAIRLCPALKITDTLVRPALIQALSDIASGAIRDYEAAQTNVDWKVILSVLESHKQKSAAKPEQKPASTPAPQNIKPVVKIEPTLAQKIDALLDVADEFKAPVSMPGIRLYVGSGDWFKKSEQYLLASVKAANLKEQKKVIGLFLLGESEFAEIDKRRINFAPPLKDTLAALEYRVHQVRSVELSTHIVKTIFILLKDSPDLRNRDCVVPRAAFARVLLMLLPFADKSVEALPIAEVFAQNRIDLKLLRNATPNERRRFVDAGILRLNQKKS